MGAPLVKVVEVPREKIPTEYLDLLAKNPLLARIEGHGRTLGWTDQEIRTYQLLTAVASNASLQAKLADLENARRVVVAAGR